MDSSQSAKDSIGLLQGLVRRLRTDPRFMASLIARYQSVEKLSDEEIRRKLKLSDLGLTRIALCVRPSSGKTDFSENVQMIASYASADAGKLAGIIRQVEVLDQVLGQNKVQEPGLQPREQPSVAHGFLAAARDRTDAEGEDHEQVDRAVNEEKDDHVA